MQIILLYANLGILFYGLLFYFCSKLNGMISIFLDSNYYKPLLSLLSGFLVGFTPVDAIIIQIQNSPSDLESTLIITDIARNIFACIAFIVTIYLLLSKKEKPDHKSLNPDVD